MYVFFYLYVMGAIVIFKKLFEHVPFTVAFKCSESTTC